VSSESIYSYIMTSDVIRYYKNMFVLKFGKYLAQFTYSLFWNDLFHFLGRWSYTSILHTSTESTLCFHIVIISGCLSNSEFGLRATLFLVTTRSSIFHIDHAQGDIPISLWNLHGVIYHDYSQRAYPISNFKFVRAYIMLEITLIHFQFVHK
jgi:hypothetical protein